MVISVTVEGIYVYANNLLNFTLKSLYSPGNDAHILENAIFKVFIYYISLLIPEIV